MIKGPENEHKRTLIITLRRSKSPFWRAVARHLSKPARKSVEVNLLKINKLTKINDTVIVPGKVLGYGALSHPITVGAFSYSSQAKAKIEMANGKAFSIEKIYGENPSGKGLMLLT
ncbi:MAG: 50S ribosomal protein L18e [Candidatus Micrarchaeia archaeon]